MWDTVHDAAQVGGDHLSHDMPCVRCGHAAHRFLACGESCQCQPALMPGESVLATA